MFGNYFAIGAVNIFVMLVLLYMIIHNCALTPSTKRYFLYSVFSTILIILCELATSYFELTNTPFNHFYFICNIVGFALSPSVAAMLALTFNNPRNYKVLLLPLIINLVLTLLSPKYGFIFYITPNNTYLRGNLFFIYILSYVCAILFLLFAICDYIRRYFDDSIYTLLLMFVFIILGTTIQIAFPHIHTSWLCITFAILVLYAYFCEMSQKKDTLTDLFNHGAYEYHLLRLEKSKRATILIFDIDNFKHINDQYGHQYGDFCIKSIAHIIKKIFSTIGICYRIGGDEFCVLSKIAEERTVAQTIETFARCLGEFQQMDVRIPDVSIGYAFYHRTNGDIKHTVVEADTKMYACKQIRKTAFMQSSTKSK